MPHTKEIVQCMASYEYTIENWDNLNFECITEYSSLIQDGKSILRKQTQDIKLIIDSTMRFLNIGNTMVPVVNAPFILCSEICNVLAKTQYTYPFVASYYDSKGVRKFSLRSIGDFDVSEIAQKYGGGGHKNASAFTVPFSELAERKLQ